MVPKDRYNVSTHAREARYLASRGYLVLVPNFRNYGASSVVDENPELIRLGQLRDAVNMVQVVRLGRIEESNPSKIGLWGVGHGGSLALKTAVLTRPSAVFVASPTGGQESIDQELFAKGMAPDIAASMDAMYGKADNPDTITWYRSMTYSNFLADIGCPVGIIAGELDPIVKVDSVRQMMSVLTPAGVQAMMSTFPRTGHDFYGQDWVSLMMTAEQFLRQPLQPAPLPPPPPG
jgi:dipeptidyl aminopeptidase/acylaminoacyl peptidase